MIVLHDSVRMGVCVRHYRLGRIAGTGLFAAAALLAGGQAAVAQSFDAAVAAVISNQCAGLGGAGSTVGTLNAFCAAGGAGTGTATGGVTATAQGDVGNQSAQGKAKKRLEEKRAAESDRPILNGLSAGDTNFDFGALSGYVSLDYQNVNKETTSLTSGFDSNKFGGTVGLDTTIGSTVVGAAFSYGHTRGVFDGTAGNFDIDSYGGVVYTSLLLTDSLFIDGVLGYSRKETQLDRNGTLNTGGGGLISGTASSDPDADEYSAGISGGYDFSYQSFTYGPRLGVNYTLTDIDAFSETSSSGIQMAFEKQSFQSLTTSVGAQASMAISTEFGVLVPQLNADYIHEFLNDQQTLVARFVQDTGGTRISFVNDSPDRDYFGLGAGLVMVLPQGYTTYANYRALVGDSIKTTQTVTAGLRVEF